VTRRPDPEGVLDELREAIRPEVQAEADRRSRRYRSSQYVLYAVLLALIVAVAKLASDNHHTLSGLRTLKTQQAVERKQCERVRVLRAEINRENAASYTVLGLIERQERSPLREAIATLRATIDYLPQTDCKAVSIDPLSYQAPEPIPYDDAVRRGLADSK
jgi:hypothetical protein